jgi:hypothetical protein
MKRYYSSVLLLGILLSQLSLRGADKPDRGDAVARLQRAVSKSNIFELPSFAMKASAQVVIDKKLVDGSYQLFWNGPEQWREEVNFPGYQEIQIGGKGVVWTRRSTDYVPLAVYNLHRALGFGASTGSSPSIWSRVRLDITSKDNVKKIRERKEHGEKLICVDLERDLEPNTEICTRETDGSFIRDSSDNLDEDFQPIGEKLFPRMLSFRTSGKTLAKVNMAELTNVTQFAPNIFAPPPGVSSQPGCMNPTPARAVKKAAPHYPASARAGHIEGTTFTEVIIGIDGIPRIRRVLQSPSSDLEASSLAAIQQWRFDSAICDGQPIEMETVLQINYALSN